jgi:DNA helicase II / ATP-dependent DNA helicase PcrA
MAKRPFKPTDEQKKVIAHRGGHLQVIACAGAGKTEAISRRVATLIEEGVEPNQIIAFTFTERAAAGLKHRITQRVAEAKGQKFLDRLGPMFIGTIHAYCLRMLQDHAPEFGNYDILDENRLAGLLSREHKRLKLSSLGPQHWRPISEFIKNANIVENELIDPKKLAGTPFGDCYLAFEEMLDRYHFLTFGMLIAKAVEVLRKPALFKRVHDPLRHLIVDEYQDINPAQEALISLLAKRPVQLCVVADDDQAIYQWRGSDVTNMQDFTKRYKSATSLTLSVNRRSRPKIIATANAFAKSIKPRLEKSMDPHREAAKNEIHAWSAETEEDEAEIIAETITNLLNEGYRYKDIAILYRSVRTSSPPLLEVFKKKEIPFSCAGRTGLFLQPEAQVFGKTYAWLLGNDWKKSRFEKSNPVELDEIVVEFCELFNDSKPIPGLEPYLVDWQKMVDSNTQEVNLVRDYYKMLNLLGAQNLDLDNVVDAARMGGLARFSQILADFEHSKRRARYVEENGIRAFRGGQDRGLWYYRQLFNYLQFYALDAYEDFGGEDSFDVNAVDILTVHQAKGLEWPIVFLPSLVNNRFPSKYAGNVQNWLLPDNLFPAKARRRYEGGETEERRLFYVALTRAKDMVYLSRPQRRTNRFAPSIFLLEVAGDPPIQSDLPVPGPFTPPDDEVEELPTLSFSELAHYDECPMRYRLNTSFGFQPQLVRELGYGRAIHHILRHIAELAKEKKRLPTKQEVEKVFHDSFYLPFANFAAFEQMLNGARKMVDRYLTDHKDDLLRIWQTERPFELHLREGIVNGRADVILDQEGGKVEQLAIVDYKTANEPKQDDVFAFQLAIYAEAGRGEGLKVKAAYLHQLKESKRVPITVDTVKGRVARNRADALIASIIEEDFPPRPEKKKCTGCDMRAICKHAECDKYDL